MAKPRALVFDWDNTLVDTWPVILTATNAVMEAMGRPPWTLEEAKARVRRSMRDTFPDMFGARWEEAAEVFFETFGRIHLEGLRESPGAGTLLRRLDEAGYYLAVVSNKTGPLLRKEAEHLGWNDRFGCLVGAGDAKRDKPARDPVDMALVAGGLAAGDEVWFVGDTDVDMECAARSDCIPVLIRAEPPGPGEFTANPPRHYFTECESLCSYLRNL